VSILLPDGTPAEPGLPPRPPPPRPTRDLSPRTVLMVLGIVLGVLLVLSLGYLAWRAIASLFVAAFLAMALNPLVVLLQRRAGLRRAVAATVVFLVAFALFAGLSFLVVPPLVSQTVDFVEGLPDLIREADRGAGPLGFLERKFDLVDRIESALEDGGAAAALGFTTPVVDAARAAIATAFSAVAILFLTFFMLLDGRRLVDRVLDVLPDGTRPRWERVFAGIYRTVGGYVAGNLLISICAGVVAGITLFAVGVPFAVALGILVAVLDLIPLVGAALATVVVGLVALTEGWTPALIVVAVLLVYQQFENHVLQPLVYGRSVQLSPLAILASVLIGAELAGVLGALAAIPIGGSVAVIGGEFVRWKRESLIETPPGVRLAEDAPEESLDEDPEEAS
jgi:predicted PurR-regulated permease PerM